MRRRLFSIITVLCAALLAQGATVSQSQQQRSVLLIVMDDIGYDTFEYYRTAYPADPDDPNSVVGNLNELARGGIRFTQTWSNPLCSPTRATILSGLYGFRTGVTKNADADPNNTEQYELPAVVNTLAEHTSFNAYGKGAFGKWHLSYYDRNEPVKCHGQPVDNGYPGPLVQGFQEYFGSYSNLLRPPDDNPDYWMFLRSDCSSSYCIDSDATCGRLDGLNNHATLETTQNAVDWIVDQSNLPAPWFAYVAYNAAHAPWQHPAGYPGERQECTDAACRHLVHKELTQHMDRRIAELLATVLTADANAVVIIVGDNGTPGAADALDPSDADRDHKSSLYEGGIHVPLIISTAETRARLADDEDAFPLVSNALVNTTDLYATAAELATGDSTSLPTDSKSLKPLIDWDPSWNPDQSVRVFAYSEIGDDAAIRNTSHKLILRKTPDSVELYKFGPAGSVSSFWEDPNENLLPLEQCQSPEYRINLKALRTLCVEVAQSASWEGNSVDDFADHCGLPVVGDMDVDGIGDALDNCAALYNVSQMDSDEDGVGNDCDHEPQSADPDDDDPDGDGIMTGCDTCPVLYNPGIQQDADDDCDGIADADDNCPLAYNPGQQDVDGDTNGDVCDECPAYPPTDGDCDGVEDDIDTCPSTHNPGCQQTADADGDGHGDVCDACRFLYDPQQNDDDCDGVEDADDNCRQMYNPGQEDGDDDGFADVCDMCPAVYNEAIPDPDYLGDLDCDGVANGVDSCELAYNPGPEQDQDTDMDGTKDACDKCPSLYNPDQEDGDEDGQGDVCDACPAHIQYADGDCDGVLNGSDNCSSAYNPDQLDGDCDGRGDVCDGGGGGSCGPQGCHEFLPLPGLP